MGGACGTQGGWGTKDGCRVLVGKPEFGRPLGRPRREWEDNINPLNAELNPICHLLALLGAHHIFHVRRIRVKMIVKETVGLWSVLDRIHLTEDGEKWRAFVSTVMNLRDL